MKKLFYLFILFNLSALLVKAQNTVITDDNAYTPHSSAILDIKSISKGFLLPRLTTVQRVAIPSPADGLVVYDTDMKAIYIYRSSFGWLNALSASLLWGSTGNNMYPANNSAKIGIGTSNPTAKLTIVGDAGGTINDTLFVVRNKDGEPVFAVFPEGVHIWMEDGAKSNIGGFAVSGRSAGKSVSEYLRVTSDSTRIYVNTSGKGNIGGFAVSGRSAGKGISQSFLYLEPENYFIGHEAGKKITTGTKNLFIGYKAGLSNTQGITNIFIGEESGFYNRCGKNNIFVGYCAGRFNVGDSSSLTIGHDNIYIGSFAGDSNVNGQHNTLIGSYSGYKSSGTKNTFFGAFTGFASSGLGNVFMGVDAGRMNTAGDYNTFLGTAAGRNNSGANNTFIGYGAGYNNYNGSGSVLIGDRAGMNDINSNRLYISNSNTSTPLIYGEFDNKKLLVNGYLQSIYTLLNNDASAIYGSHNVTPWYGRGVHGIGGFEGVLGEAKLSGSGSRAGVHGEAANGASNNIGGYFTGTGGTKSYGIYAYGSSGTVCSYGIYAWANGDSAWAGWFQGNIRCTGAYNPSDKNLKKNITAYKNALDKINQLNIVSFEYKDESELKQYYNNSTKPDLPTSFNLPTGIQYGVIAQELEKVFPQMVKNDADGLKGVDYTKLIPILLQAIKEQQKLIQQQQEEINAIKIQISK